MKCRPAFKKYPWGQYHHLLSHKYDHCSHIKLSLLFVFDFSLLSELFSEVCIFFVIFHYTLMSHKAFCWYKGLKTTLDVGAVLTLCDSVHLIAFLIWNIVNIIFTAGTASTLCIFSCQTGRNKQHGWWDFHQFHAKLCEADASEGDGVGGLVAVGFWEEMWEITLTNYPPTAS